MIWAVFKIMALKLWRDKGALVLAFVLPGFIFAIFAAIFSSASGGNLDIRVSMALTTDAPSAREFSDVLNTQDAFTLTYDPAWGEADITQRVRLGVDDVGLIIAGDLSTAPSPIIIITEPSRDVAASVLSGQIRQLLASHMPHILLDQNIKTVEQLAGGYNPAQTAALMAARDAVKTQPTNTAGDNVITARSAMDGTNAPVLKDASVAYYVGATTILFLLFSAMQGAALSLEERGSGITQRLLLGPKGASAMMAGKFVFLTLQGTLQAGVIIAVAALGFDVPVMARIPSLLLMSIASAAAASAIALLVATLSKTSVQMHTVSTFTVLLLSAIGGSMVPRFMMPDWLQSLGRFTPNAWSIEGFYSVLARGSAASDIALPLAILGAITTGCLLLAAALSHKLLRY